MYLMSFSPPSGMQPYVTLALSHEFKTWYAIFTLVLVECMCVAKGDKILSEELYFIVDCSCAATRDKNFSWEFRVILVN